MLTLNQELENRAVLHAIRIVRLRKGEAARMNKLVLDSTESLIHRTLTGLAKKRGMTGAFLNTKSHKKLIEDSVKLFNKAFKDALEALEGNLEKIALTEAQWAVELINGTAPIALGAKAPSIPIMRQITRSRPFQGKLLNGWFKELAEVSQKAYKSAVAIGMTLGESNAIIAARVSDALGVSARKAAAVTRTAVTHVTTHAREEVYKNNEDIVKGVRYMATLDSVTTMECAGLDGQIFDVNEGPRPPIHVQCRSTTSPILKSWEELGIDLKEPPPLTRASRKYEKGLPKDASPSDIIKSSMRGEVPATQNYGSWLKNQPHAVQREVLGTKRAQLFRDGEVTIDKFVDKRFRTITLDKLLT